MRVNHPGITMAPLKMVNGNRTNIPISKSN